MGDRDSPPWSAAAMKPALVLALVAAALAGGAHAVDVYKWKDGKGVVHYGDRPASGASAARVSVRDDQVDPDDAARAQQRLSETQDRLQDEASSDEPEMPPRETVRPKAQADTGSCAYKWRLYMQSQGCFDSHRVAGGKGVTRNGARVCPQIVQPDCPHP
jgi:hypothetical protein